ncbi:MAG: helical backbone metal receptor [Dehalogenimonas sp.]
MIVIDQVDREININFPIRRLVSLAPSITESIYALGAEELLFGVTEFCDYPKEAKLKPKIGGYSTVDIDRINLASPDLILASKIQYDRNLKSLEATHRPVLILESSSLTGMLKTIEILGQCSGKKAAAEMLINGLYTRIESVTAKNKRLTLNQRPRVYFLHELETWKTFGAGTIGDELTDLAGGYNIGRDFGTGYPRPTLSEIARANPDIIIAETGYGENPQAPFEKPFNEPQLANVKAILTRQVYGVDSSLISRAGPRMVDGLESLARIFHPSIFIADHRL